MSEDAGINDQRLIQIAYGAEPLEANAPSSFAASAGSAENIRLPNDTKIRFCNALDALQRHGIDCRDCATYIKWGDGDLCAKGKDLIARELAYADTKIEFPSNPRI